MEQHTAIVDILKNEKTDYKVYVKGWVRTFRNNQFIALSDGTCQTSLQVVIDRDNTEESILKRINTGAAIAAVGTVIPSQGKGQKLEIAADKVVIIGDSDAESYPLQPKKHSLEFLREIAHLRFRTNTFGAVFRIRHHVAFAIHKFFNDQGYFYLHSPIITGSDAEGAGEMFRVTTLDLHNLPKSEDGAIDHKQDFFNKETNLTVSGQLEAELGACSLSKVYTFGPTFRAENSNTSRHLAEFWMIEPEIAFADLDENMNVAEAMLKFVIQYVLEHCPDELAFLEQRLLNEEKQKPQNERSPMPLIEKLKF
ncbi:MAG: amino acid--tRNA ligase-related protein, partial [Bacteroidota bacterium]